MTDMLTSSQKPTHADLVAMATHGRSGLSRLVLGSVATGTLQLAHVPLLLVRRSFWGLVLALNWWDIIDEQMFLGGAMMFDDLARLQRQGVEAVVNLCAERPDNPREEGRVKQHRQRHGQGPTAFASA